MKKILLYSSIAIMTMVACGKEKAVESNVQPKDKATYEFTISVNADEIDSDTSNPAQIGTKTSYAGETTFSWSAGDQISVLFHDAGDNNAFYTLTATSIDGKNATFSGTIDAGWTVGASDTGDKWALYPAGNHTYTATAPVFSIPAEVDYSATHFSANLPMYAIGADDGAGNDVYAFKHVENVGAYKFSFSNLDVSKVRLVIEQLGSYYINGNFQLTLDGTEYKFSPWAYSFSSDPAKIRTFTANVVGKTASFYIPFKTWEANLKPVLTLYDAATGFTLGSWTAGSTMPYSTGNVVVAKPFSAPGTGSPLLSAFGINWGSLDMYPADDSKDSYPGDGTRIIDWKVTSDATNIYFYYKTSSSVAQTRGLWESYIVTGFDTDNDSDTGADGSYGLGAGFEARSIAFPFTNAAGDPVSFRAPGSPNSSSNIKCPISGSSLATVATNGSANGEYAYVEICIPREHIGSPASSATIRVRNAYGSTSCAAQTLTLQ